eukprot:TRINITY_DN12210_c0_g1_i1.p1 TRINITY_DN12210_c0_g1~~TRINITY_DN12210_c0_g1_i1.p1  ORF type:complete len:113 (-),score=1.02 TRINITY_DN12210_c0_g1_i1:132-470(-)
MRDFASNGTHVVDRSNATVLIIRITNYSSKERRTSRQTNEGHTCRTKATHQRTPHVIGTSQLTAPKKDWPHANDPGISRWAESASACVLRQPLRMHVATRISFDCPNNRSAS